MNLPSYAFALRVANAWHYVCVLCALSRRYRTVPYSLSRRHRTYSLNRLEGARGFYKGISISMLQSLPNVCIVFLLYELIRQSFDDFYLDAARRRVDDGAIVMSSASSSLSDEDVTSIVTSPDDVLYGVPVVRLVPSVHVPQVMTHVTSHKVLAGTDRRSQDTAVMESQRFPMSSGYDYVRVKTVR